MSDFEEILEVEEKQHKVTPVAVKTLAILSYIGHGILILAIVIAIAFLFSASSGTSGIFGGRAGNANFMGVFIGVCIGILFICGIAIWGAVKMHRGRRSGFVFYAIGNGLPGLLMLTGSRGQLSNVIIGLLLITFIVLFGRQLKYLN